MTTTQMVVLFNSVFLSGTSCPRHIWTFVVSMKPKDSPCLCHIRLGYRTFLFPNRDIGAEVGLQCQGAYLNPSKGSSRFPLHLWTVQSSKWNNFRKSFYNKHVSVQLCCLFRIYSCGQSSNTMSKLYSVWPLRQLLRGWQDESCSPDISWYYVVYSLWS
jgi:hypothetical protein